MGHCAECLYRSTPLVTVLHHLWVRGEERGLGPTGASSAGSQQPHLLPQSESPGGPDSLNPSFWTHTELGWNLASSSSAG